MTKENFNSSMLFMQKIFGTILDDEILSYYWLVFKAIPDVQWRAAIETTVKTFIPTSQVPFPAIAIIQKNIPEIKNHEPMYLSWEGFKVNESELPTPEEIEKFIDSLPPVFRPTNRTNRNGKIEKLGDIQ